MTTTLDPTPWADLARYIGWEIHTSGAPRLISVFDEVATRVVDVTFATGERKEFCADLKSAGAATEWEAGLLAHFAAMEIDDAPPRVVESDEVAALKARITELESRTPEVRIAQVEVEPDPPAAPYVPDFTLIPDALAKFAQADETATEFRSRLKRLWQRFGIADGENFPGGGEPLTGEEKITMREIDIVLNSDEGKNASLLNWLLADEQRT